MSWFKWHKHTWGVWFKDICIYGNALGEKREREVRARRCEECLKVQIKPLGK